MVVLLKSSSYILFYCITSYLPSKKWTIPSSHFTPSGPSCKIKVIIIFNLPPDDLLDELVNLLDRDSDDDFIDELYQDKQEQEDDNTTTTNDCQDVANDGDDDDQAKGTHVSPENMSSRFSQN